tara:strand:- start:2797 stop:3702 length:906 start_codon:yes stop_codon:yes gene_type:complete
MAAGAVGGYFGSVLSYSNDVTFVARGEHLRKIQEYGLSVKSVTSGNYVCWSKAYKEPPPEYKADLAIFCVKEYQNEQACEIIANSISDNTTILTLQNGLGSGEFLGQKFGSEKVVLGAAYVEASKGGPGEIFEHGGGCSITFGKQSDIQEGRVRELANIFESSNVDFTVSENIHDSLWQKLVFISALSGMTCITKSTFKEVMNHPETRNITINLVRETASVASKIVPNFSKDTVQNTIDHLETHKNDLVSSMHQDLLAGKPMEINAINGAVSRKGKTLGIATPINDMIVSCLSLQDTRARK